MSKNIDIQIEKALLAGGQLLQQMEEKAAHLHGCDETERTAVFFFFSPV